MPGALLDPELYKPVSYKPDPAQSHEQPKTKHRDWPHAVEQLQHLTGPLPVSAALFGCCRRFGVLCNSYVPKARDADIDVNHNFAVLPYRLAGSGVIAAFRVNRLYVKRLHR